MKQTNSAIKFLIAQYRAIFRNANKAMLTALATAAALAASQPAYAAQGSTFDNGGFKADSAVNITMEGTTTADDTQGKYKNFTISGGEAAGAFTNDKENVLTVTGGKGDSGSVFKGKDQGKIGIINLANTTLTIAGTTDNNTDAAVRVGDTDSGAALTLGNVTVGNGRINVVKGSLTANSITLGNNGLLMLTDGDASGTELTLESGSAVEITKGTLGKAEQTLSVVEGSTIEGKAAAASVAEAKVASSLDVAGTLKVDDGKGLTVDGSTTLKSGSTFVGSGTTVFTKGATIEDNVTLTIGTSGKVHLGDASTLNIKSADLKKLLSGAEVAGLADAKVVVQLTDESSADKPLALGGTSIIGDSDGAVSNKLKKNGNGTLTVKGGYAKYAGANDMTGQDGVTLSFKALTYGKDAAVTFKTGGVAVSESLTIAGDQTLTVDSGSSLTLATDLDSASGSVSAKSITLGSGKAVGKLNVDKGSWTVPALTVTSGAVTVKDKSVLTVGGALTATAKDSVVIQGGTVDVQGDGSLALANAAAGTVKMTNGGQLKIDAADILKGTAFDATNFKKDAVAGDGTTYIVIKGGDKMTQKQFEDFRDATGFTGVFDMGGNVEIKTPEKGTLTTDNIVKGLQTDALSNSTLNVTDSAKNKIDFSASVGNVNVKAKEDVKLVAGGSLILNNSNAEGTEGHFVTKQATEGSGSVVGGVQFTDAGNGLTLIGSGDIASISASGDKLGTVVLGKGGEKPAAGVVTVVAGNSVGAQGNSIKDLTLLADSSLNVVSGDVYAVNLDAQSGTNITVKGKVVTNDLQFIGDVLKADSLEITGNAGPAVTKNLIAGGAQVDLGTLKIGANQLLEIGQNDAAVPENSSTAGVYAGTLELGTGALFIDPTNAVSYSYLATNNLTGPVTDKVAGTLNGTVTVGNNGVFGVGFNSDQELVDMLGKYTDANGALKDFKSALVLNKGVQLNQANDGITVDPSANTATAAKGQVNIKSGSALVVTDEVYSIDAQGNKSGSAISFAGTAGTADVTDSQLILIGDFSGADKAFSLFSNAGTVTGADTMKIASANGLLTGKLNGDGTAGLEFSRKKADEVGAFADAAAPVRELLYGKLEGTVKGKGAGFDLISDVATSSLSGVVADAAAHAATYAGAQQAAVASVTTMADAMFGRVGSVGVEAASISATGSQANGGVWLTPMYKSVDADGFNAEGASYGADVDVAGVAFGTDTVNGNMRFGAVFNIGSGESEGKGNGAGLKNDFDYYGFGIYSAMGFGSFALVGDASMTVISHDVEGLGLKGKADTTAVTMGVTGQYTVATPAVDVTPHLGARFIRLDTDSYDLKGDDVVATTDFDVQNVFSVPVGVTLSKAFVAGGWSLAPSADLTITFNAGDTEAKSTTQFTGAPAIGLNTEVLDEVTYGLTVGLGAQYGAFGTSFGINYTGSENTDAFGVNAQARYMF